MNKVIHLIPYDGTGGVEVAARSMQDIDAGELDFSVQCIYPHVAGYQERVATFGPLPLLRAIHRTRAQKPDLLIVSLWRACVVGVLVKLIRPRLRLVLMLHSTRHAHWLDRLWTNITGLIADEWWGDSPATVNERLGGSPRKTKRVISFVTRRLKPSALRQAAPSFIFWGRVSAIKGIDRALGLFAEVAKRRPDARFTIIGPDGGAKAELQSLVARMGLQHAVRFRGGLDITEISAEAASASFYLQASRYEGMAMSVVEAMQLGLVPVVTPVGEIRNYCRDGHNAIVIRSDGVALAQLLNVLEDADLFTAISRNAVATWQGRPLYAASMLDACRSALMGSPGATATK